MSSPLRSLDGAVSPHVIRSMRDRIDLLEEEVRQYRDAIEVFRPYPPEWGLTKTEGRALNALHRARSGFISREQLLVSLYGLEPDVEPKIIDVYVCKLRRKLAGTGIEIRTSWGAGFGLTPEGVLALNRIQAEGVDLAQAERAAAAERLAARIAELEAENAALKAAIDAASVPAEPPAPAPEPVTRKRRRDWRDFAKPQPKGRLGAKPPLRPPPGGAPCPLS